MANRDGSEARLGSNVMRHFWRRATALTSAAFARLPGRVANLAFSHLVDLDDVGDRPKFQEFLDFQALSLEQFIGAIRS